MAQSTEAACLLQSGRMYPSRVGLKLGSGEDVFAGLKAGVFSLYFGDEPIFHFDFEGRWQRAFIDGVHYLKGLDATVRAIDRPREGANLVLRRRTLDRIETIALDESIRQAALDLLQESSAEATQILPPPPPARLIDLADLREWLGRVSGWDRAAWEGHRTRYASTYGPWPLLPADSRNPLVLQVSPGPNFGKVRERGDRTVSTPSEFRGHARAVKRLLGRRLAQCHDIVLAGDALLGLAAGTASEYVRIVGEVFPEDAWTGEPAFRRPRQVVAYLDLDGPVPDREGWRMLAASGLGRVWIGVESGDPILRSFYGKTWENEALQTAIADLKAAGLAAGLLALAGVGGKLRSEEHLAATARLIGSLGLDVSGLVCLVACRSVEGEKFGWDPLTVEEADAQMARMKQERPLGDSSRPFRVVAYSPDKQWA